MIHFFPQLTTYFLDKIAHPNKKRGPATCFSRTLHDIGWKCLPGGICEHQCGFRINWLTCSKQYLAKFFEHFWGNNVGEQVKQRKLCSDFQYDLQTTAKLLQKLPTWDQGVLVTYVSGNFFTRDILTKFCRDVTVQCPYCNCRDSRQHRVWECAMFEDLRKKHPDMLSWLAQQPKWVSDMQ